MSDIAIQFDNVGKLYKLGTVGTGTLSHDLNRWWKTTVLRQEDPYLKIGETNDRSKKGSSEYVWALKDITFDVKQGDVVGIIGKNGAGKSTLLKLLSRVTSPTTGAIRAKGRIASLLEVGTGFHPELTGRENIYMNGSIMGMTRREIDRKLDEIVDFAGVERYIDTPVKRYSSGMTVRLGFAVAAFLEPEILVVDEVLAVGDAEFQKKAIGKMQDVSKGEGRTVLFVSHNMAAVRNLCTKGILLKNGMVDCTGNIDDTIETYMINCLDSTKQLPLKEMPRERKCTGTIHFTNIEFLNKENQFITPRCGKFLRIRLTLETAYSISDCRISLGIRDYYGSPLMTFATDLTMNNFSLSGDKNHFAYLDIEKLPLTVGNYRIGLWADVQKECADYLDNTIGMEVEDDDFFNNGRNISQHLCGKVILCNHQWVIE